MHMIGHTEKNRIGIRHIVYGDETVRSGILAYVKYSKHHSGNEKWIRIEGIKAYSMRQIQILLQSLERIAEINGYYRIYYSDDLPKKKEIKAFEKAGYISNRFSITNICFSKIIKDNDANE